MSGVKFTLPDEVRLVLSLALDTGNLKQFIVKVNVKFFFSELTLFFPKGQPHL